MDDLECLVRLNLSGMVGSSLLRRLLEHHQLRRIPRPSRRELELVALRRLTRDPQTAESLAAAPRLPLSSAERALDTLSGKRMEVQGVGGGFTRPADGATMARHGPSSL